jgi:chorismate synthase
VFEGRTTGTPIQLMIENTDQRSKDYGDIAQPSGPAMPTSPITRNTACATIAAAAGPRPAKPRRAWPPAAWPAPRWRDLVPG